MDIYQVEFTLKYVKAVTGWSSIFRFTNKEGNDKLTGNRILAVFIHGANHLPYIALDRKGVTKSH